MSGEEHDKEMDEKRKQIADNVIRKMVNKGASTKDITQQQKVNKETLGHEGDIS